MTVMLGVPSGRNAITSQTVATLMNVSEYLKKRDIATSFINVCHADVTVSRNLLAASFLASDADTFFGIDDDVGASINVIDLLFQSNLPFIGAFIPQRSINLDFFEKQIIEGHRGREARIKAAPLVGAGRIDQTKIGIHQTPHIGTGLYLLKRSVLEEIIDKKIVKKERIQQAGYTADGYGFFNNIVTDSSYLSEDYSFCHRVSSAGILIHGYAGPGVTHTGFMTFSS